MDLADLREIMDQKYKVDIMYQLTRDLYEKQRVHDQFANENSEEVVDFTKGYRNMYKKADVNAYAHQIYHNPYDMRRIRRKIYKAAIAASIFTSPIAFVTGSIIPPLLLISPEIFNWLRIWVLFSQVVDTIVLSEDKHHVSITSFNMFGFKKKPSIQNFRITDIDFNGLYKNQLLNQGDRGVITIVSKFLRGKQQKQLNQGNDPDSISHLNQWKLKITEYNKFQVFVKIHVRSKRQFLLPIDHISLHQDKQAMQLLQKISNGRIFSVYGFNFEERQREQEIYQQEHLRHERLKNLTAQQLHNPRQQEKLWELQGKYSDYLHNRQYHKDDQYYRRRPDDIDGTFRDVGYR